MAKKQQNGTIYFPTDSWKWLAVIWAIIPAVNTYNFMTCPIESLVDNGSGMGIRNLFSKPFFWVAIRLMICSRASEFAMVQWASAYAESALGLSKALGDLGDSIETGIVGRITRNAGNNIRIGMGFGLIFSAILLPMLFLLYRKNISKH